MKVRFVLYIQHHFCVLQSLSPVLQTSNLLCRFVAEHSILFPRPPHTQRTEHATHPKQYKEVNRHCKD
jgi:hypothetical protein